jgi:hypothetical protein
VDVVEEARFFADRVQELAVDGVDAHAAVLPGVEHHSIERTSGDLGEVDGQFVGVLQSSNQFV